MLIRTMLITLGIALIEDISSLYLVLMKWKAQVKYRGNEENLKKINHKTKRIYLKHNQNLHV